MQQQQQRDTSSSMTTTLASSSSRAGSISHGDSVGARLITFSSTSSRSSSINEVEHRYVPRPMRESDTQFECCLAIFKLISLILQHLLIYKSDIWISSNSQNIIQSILHWNLIDRYLIIILTLFCLVSNQKLFALQAFINFLAVIYSFWFYSWKHALVFTYPFVCSLLINREQHQQQISILSDYLPEHWCSNHANDLRDETDCLRQEFNQRIRYILFSSLLSSYHICIVPLTFSNTNFIRLELILLLKYDAILFLSLIMIYISHYLPLELLTVLHRNGKHLGLWHCLSTNHLATQIWDEKSELPYEPNSIVKYKRQVYRSSDRLLTVAEPGNQFHARFALLFGRPMVFPIILGILQMFLLLIQIFLLLSDQRWFVHSSQMILFLMNTYTLRHTTRDIYLLYMVYC